MPVIRIVQRGFETFTGILGSIQFKDGVSVEPVSQAEAERIGCFTRIEDATTGQRISLTERMVQTRTKNHTDLGLSVERTTKPLERTTTGKVKTKVKPAELPKTAYEREDLEQLADVGGIAELRKFAKQWNVNGKTIVEIIESLMALKAQSETRE